MSPHAELVERAARGDRPALEELLARHLPGLRAYLRAEMGPDLRVRESASDLAQSACREVLERIGRLHYGGEAGFKRWLYATARRKVLHRAEHWAAARRGAGTREIGRIDPEAEQGLARFYSSFCSPSRQAAAREQIERVESALDRLPAEERRVIVLAHVMEMSRAEIGRRLDRSPAAVRSLLCRALARLAELLDEE